MKSTNLVLLVVSALLLFSCAKDRPIDTDGSDAAVNRDAKERINKSTFNKKTLWYSKATIVRRSDTTPKEWMFVGSAGSLKVGYFEFDEEQLSFYDAVNPNNKNEDKHTMDDMLYSWPVTHSEYSLKESNGEVKNVQIEDPQLEWNKKNFFFVDFSKGQISPRSDIGSTASECWKPVSKRLVPGSMQVSASHIAYNVQYVYEYSRWFSWNCNTLTTLHASSPTYTVELRHSFKPRVENNYKPYVYSGENDPLMKKYGFFKTKVFSKDEDGQLEITWLMNRWNPEREMVTYFFDKDTPEKLKHYYTDADRGIFRKLNDVMAGTDNPIRFQIKDYDGTCEYGDVGCSFIKINTEAHNSAPLGYGPSDADPLTGEIIAGRTMIWTDSMMRMIKLYMHATETYKKTAPEESTVYKLMKKTLGEEDITKWTNTSTILNDITGKTGNSEGETQKIAEIADAYRFLLPQYTYASENYNWTTFAHTTPARTHVTELNEMKEFMAGMKSSGMLPTTMLKEVEAHFNAELEIANLEAANKEAWAKFIPAGQYSGCHDFKDSMIDGLKGMVVNGKSADDIFDTLFYLVAIHELGHTLNLEHNFYGSVDQKNFSESEPSVDIHGNPVYKRNQDGSYFLDSDGNKVQLISTAASTTVMEYLAPAQEYDEIDGWGPYDIAALQYAYSSGDVDSDKDFLLCGHDNNNYMAMCNTWDTGSTPSEVVFSLISSYENRYPYMNYRYGRAIWNTYGHGGRAWGLMWKLKTFMKMQKATYQLGDMQRKLAYKHYDKASVTDIYNAVQADMKQAVKLTLAYFDAMIHQKDSDRNFRDTVNEEYGTVEKLGIWPEKVYAMIMLYYNHYIQYNSNEGYLLTSYLDYLDVDEKSSDADKELADTYKTILSRGLTERVDEYADVDIFRYEMFIDSTVDSAGTAGSAEISNLDMAGVQCYRANSFQETFGQTLGFEDANEFKIPAATLPEYFRRALGEDGLVTVAALRSNNRVYVATKEQNPISYEIIKDAVDLRDASWAMTAMRRGARKLKMISAMYNEATGELESYCQ